MQKDSLLSAVAESETTGAAISQGNARDTGPEPAKNLE